MELIKLDTRKVGIEISEEIKREAIAANELLHAGEGKGNDFLGWITLPSDIDQAHLDAINAQAAKLREVAEVVICIGIGGSYLGAKAVIDAMTNSFELLHKTHKNPIVLFAGQNISEDYLGEMMEALKEYSIATVVASKSGTTTEPAIAFRIVKEEIERRYGKQGAKDRIVAITDKSRGALKTLATQEGYPTFVIPDSYQYEIMEVSERYIARPDILSMDIYGDALYSDLLCKLNGISNPFELNKGMLIVVPSPDCIHDFMKQPTVEECDSVTNSPKPVAKKKNEKRKANDAIVGDSRFKIDKSRGVVIY